MGIASGGAGVNTVAAGGRVAGKESVHVAILGAVLLTLADEGTDQTKEVADLAVEIGANVGALDTKIVIGGIAGVRLVKPHGDSQERIDAGPEGLEDDIVKTGVVHQDIVVAGGVGVSGETGFVLVYESLFFRSGILVGVDIALSDRSNRDLGKLGRWGRDGGARGPVRFGYGWRGRSVFGARGS